MKLKVKDMDIATGGILVVLVNEKDAEKFDLHHEDRVSVKKGRKKTTAIVDIGESDKVVKPGQIGLFEEVVDELNAKPGDIIDMDLEEKPKGVDHIKKKLEGKNLSKEETDEIVREIVERKLSAIELTYFIAACYTRKMNLEETVNLTKAIVKYGNKLKLRNKIIVDKHCTGGVPGNRTTMIVVPIVAAAGLTIPKTSSRSITSPAGTADTMEVLAPVELTLKKMKKVVQKTNGCIILGGGVDLASADDKLIKLRHPLSLDPEGMLLASILAKKAAVNSNHVLIDIPIGKDTKIKNKKEADHLKKLFIKIGKKMGMKVKAIITDGTEPVGNGIGPALEARDVLWVLKRDKRGPKDLEKKCIRMATDILKSAGVKGAGKKVKDILENGKAYAKMKEIIKAQGGNPNINPDKIKPGKYQYTYKAPKSATITDIDNFTVSKIARIAGAPKDQGAGIFLYRHEGQKVKKGQPIFTVYAENKTKLKYARNILKKIGEIRVNHTYL
ncbi:AMP phosphorylase [Candidatus Woesearchaeota archaeon]|nr:AMP phosphorylase [Candidatus Woesearchaeota archaeon]